MDRALRMLPLIGVLVSGVLFSPVSSGEPRGQGELVIHKQGTKLYHRASCPLVAGASDVLALSRAQAEGRGYKPHEECDPANPDTAPDGKPKPETVYLDGTRYYHRKSCARLEGKSASEEGKVKSASLEDAGKSHWPCPTCKPPIRKRSTPAASPGTGRKGG